MTSFKDLVSGSDVDDYNGIDPEMQWHNVETHQMSTSGTSNENETLYPNISLLILETSTGIHWAQIPRRT